MVFNCTHKKLWLFKQYFIVITINFFTIEEVKKTKNTSCRFRAICEHNLFTPTPTVNFNKFVSLSNMKKKNENLTHLYVIRATSWLAPLCCYALCRIRMVGGRGFLKLLVEMVGIVVCILGALE